MFLRTIYSKTVRPTSLMPKWMPVFYFVWVWWVNGKFTKRTRVSTFLKHDQSSIALYRDTISINLFFLSAFLGLSILPLFLLSSYLCPGPCIWQLFCSRVTEFLSLRFCNSIDSAEVKTCFTLQCRSHIWRGDFSYVVSFSNRIQI